MAVAGLMALALVLYVAWSGGARVSKGRGIGATALLILTPFTFLFWLALTPFIWAVKQLLTGGEDHSVHHGPVAGGVVDGQPIDAGPEHSAVADQPLPGETTR